MRHGTCPKAESVTSDHVVTAVRALGYQTTGSYRTAVVSLLTFVVIGFVMLAAVPMRRAILAVGDTPPRVL